MSEQPSPERSMDEVDRRGHVVGIGASAGGLEALEAVVAHLPEGLGIAYVVVQHLSPDFESHMVELLARRTALAVRAAADGEVLAPDTVHVLPPGKEISIERGRVILSARPTGEGTHLPVDHFLESLAAERGAEAVGLILSGTGSDGSRGVSAVHAAGGLVLAQAPDTAAFPGMPAAAIETGAVDLVLGPEEVGSTLATYLTEGLDAPALAARAFTARAPEALDGLFEVLAREHGVDYGAYKPGTVARRQGRRRIAVGAADMDAYVQKALSDRAELHALHSDLLIGVTRFRRDSGAFLALENEALDGLLDRAVAGRTLRVWVAGCSTGEEAYSIAISLAEAQHRRKLDLPVRILATDVNDAALAKAAEGVYGPDALSVYDDATRERHFDRVPAGLRVRSDLRRAVVFARHDFLSQPPFTQIDLLVCRNVLIYLRPHAQRRALELFHFALRSQGCLLLGPSEGLGALDDAFEAISGRWKLFRKRRDPGRTGLPPGTAPPVPLRALRGMRPRTGSPMGDDLHERILQAWLPPSALVHADGAVEHLYGGLELQLRLPRGRVSTNLLDLVEGNLRVAVAAALRQASSGDRRVRRAGVQVPWVESGEVVLGVDAVEPGADGKNNYLVSFTPSPPRPAAQEGEDTGGRMATLERDLEDARRDLQSTVEQLETSNEELQATNEELVASNEELQSTNEELQSVNEELHTVNAEHEQRIEQVSRERADMSNLLAATGVGVLFVDEEIRVRRFTPAIAGAFDLREGDVGRPLETFANTLDLEDLVGRVRMAVEHGESFEAEALDRQGRPHVVRVIPYVREGLQRGAVLTLVDISATRALARRLAQFEPVVENSKDLQALVERDGTIVFANGALARAYRRSEEEILGTRLSDLDPRWDDGDFAEMFDAVHGEGQRILRTTAPAVDGRDAPTDVSASPVDIEGDRLLFLHFRDVTEAQLALRYAEFARDAAVLAIEAVRLGPFLEELLERAGAALAVEAAWAVSVDGDQELARWPANGEDGPPEGLVAAARDATGVVWHRLEGRDAAVCAVRYWGTDRPAGALLFRLRRNAAVDRRTFDPACETAARAVTLLLRRLTSDRELRLRDRAMEASVDGISIADATDPDMPLIYVNRGFELMSGYRADEALGRNCRFLQGPETSDATRATIREALRAHRPVRATILNYRKDGTPFWNDVQLSPVRNDRGEVAQFVAVQHDITERIETERDLMVARRRAASASRAKSRFLATVSHEIRSPMTAILGFVDAIGRRARDPEVLQPLSAIRRNADHLLRLIADILDISRIEAGRLDLSMEDVDLPVLLLDVRELMSVRSDQKDLEFRIELAGALPRVVRTDPTRVRQVLVNLLGNAIKFTDEGSVTLTVAAERGEPWRLVFEVADTGLGIPLEDQERIFKPFVRPHHDDDDDRHHDGAGLGLAIVNRLVSALQGRISVDSRPGSGSVFRVEIPAEVDESSGSCETLAEHERPSADEAWAAGGGDRLVGLRVLVADDRPDVARVVRFYLEDAGAETVLVHDGRQAVEAFQAETLAGRRPDVVVLDMQMPVLDGYGAAAEIRREDQEVPIIALTAAATRRDEERSLDAGCTVFLTKPVEEDELLDMVERLGNGQKTEDAGA